MFSKLKIPVFIATVIAVECGIALCLIPPAAEAPVLAEPVVTQALPSAPSPEAPETEKEEAGKMEVDLGGFTVTYFQPSNNSTVRIDFHLYGIVTNAEQKEFLALFEENHHRIRDQVIITIRSAEMADLSDAGLGLLKRKILEKINRILGKPILRSVIFSDFLFIEQ
jgi:flagellar basal body-associated protein FliL